MDQHRQAFARQQQGQQRRQHGQLAGAGVAGQHDDRARARCGDTAQTLPSRVEEAGHFLRGFALDAHRQAKRAGFQVCHRAVEHLAKQVRRLFAVE